MRLYILLFASLIGCTGDITSTGTPTCVCEPTACPTVDGGVTLDLGETVTGGPSRDPKTGRTIEWVRVFIPAGTRVFKFLRPNVAQQPTRLRSGILRTPPTVANFRLVPAAGPSPGTEFWTSRTNLVLSLIHI